MKTTLHIDKDTFEEVPVAGFISGNPPNSGSADSATAVDPSCNATVTIRCLQQLYKTGNYKQQATQKNSIAISSYLEEFVNKEDLQAFYIDQRPDAVNSSFNLISVKGEKILFLSPDNIEIKPRWPKQSDSC